MNPKTIRIIFRLLIVIPAIYLVLKVFFGDLGADPASSLNKSLGTISIRLLLLNLYFGIAISLWRPLPPYLRWIGRERRYLGVLTFFYVLIHVTFYFIKESDWAKAVQEIIEKRYLQAGALAFVILFLMALTSNDFSVRKMRPKNWKWLHRLVHLAALALVIHLTLIEKADIKWAMIYFIPLALLQGLRIFRWAI